MKAIPKYNIVYTWACEKDEENRVEEAYRIENNELMNDCRDQEGYQLNYDSSFTEWIKETIQVKVHVIIEPVMNDYIPFSIVRTEFMRIPPIRIESTVRETGDLRP